MVGIVEASDIVDWGFFDHGEILDVDKNVVGLVSEDTDDVVQAIRGDSEVCEVAGNDSTRYFVVHHLEHAESGLVFSVEGLKNKRGVEVGVGFDFNICSISKNTVGIQKLEVTHVVEP